MENEREREREMENEKERERVMQSSDEHRRRMRQIEEPTIEWSKVREKKKAASSTVWKRWPSIEFTVCGGERTILQEHTEEINLGCKSEFFVHKHDFTDITIEANKLGDNLRCYSCNIYTHPSPIIIGCLECKIYLHQNCAPKGLQLNIRHIYHPFHCLTLKSYDSDGDRLTRCGLRIAFCHSCHGNVYAGKFMFACKSCKFQLCIQCSLRKPNIKDTVGQHHHLFTFFPGSSHNFNDEYCNGCDVSCDLDDSIVRCVNCDFNIHLYCFPSLPRTIKHRCHVDPLTLITDPDLVRSDVGYDEFYCDVCEKERDRKHPVYCCNECLFVAHIKCVISEVLPSITLPESDLVDATTTMLEQSNIQDDCYFGHITGKKAEEIEIMRNVRAKEGKKDLDMIQSVEYYFTKVIGDEVMAREFLTKLQTEDITRENGERKNKSMELVVLDEENDSLSEEIKKQTKILKDFNERLEKAKAQREELLRLQH